MASRGQFRRGGSVALGAMAAALLALAIPSAASADTYAVDRQDDGFGMGGTGGSVGWASVVGDYAFGFVTGSMGNHDRADRLENAFRSCLGLAPI